MPLPLQVSPETATLRDRYIAQPAEEVLATTRIVLRNEIDGGQRRLVTQDGLPGGNRASGGIGSFRTERLRSRSGAGCSWFRKSEAPAEAPVVNVSADSSGTTKSSQVAVKSQATFGAR